MEKILNLKNFKNEKTHFESIQSITYRKNNHETSVVTLKRNRENKIKKLLIIIYFISFATIISNKFLDIS